MMVFCPPARSFWARQCTTSEQSWGVRQAACYRKKVSWRHFSIGVTPQRDKPFHGCRKLFAALMSSPKTASFSEDPDPDIGKVRQVPLGDIFPKDYVVHRIHGVGQYLGLELLWRKILSSKGELGTSLQEYIVLKFADGILRVPVDQVDCMSRLQSGVLESDDTPIAEDPEMDEEASPANEVSTSVSKRVRRLRQSGPKLDAIGRRRSWEKRRSRAVKVVQKVAVDILRIEALRMSMKRPRYVFDPQDPRYVAFDQAFEYNKTGGLTPDQRKCVDDIFSDLCEKQTPMDRLICGDVGVGKTEVAMRAIFLAILNNRQVAVLAPTTALVAQHLRTLRRRMPDFVRIGALYRDVSTKDARQTLDDLALGKIDILVGTHSLLCERVCFHLRLKESKDSEMRSNVDAGVAEGRHDPHVREDSLRPPRDGLMLVIDEEQKFGVSQKEKIKVLDHARVIYADDVAVDVLTLSATPIPRTLYMALSGIRDVSMIHKPPASRLPVRTFILARDAKSESLVDKAIAHELRRGGQVFYVVPRIADIPPAYEHVSSSLRKMKLDTERHPILIGHGQSARLEKIMLEFASGKGRILISTTIVENGLDIPTAGTIIVANAQRLGLAQLYQLRGRVGRRANFQAYCLFIFDPKSVVNNPDAQLRLQALRELTQDRPAAGWRPRSVGLQIAQRDLEIRGAGDLLGASQSGTNWDLGPELFARMLREATEDLRRVQNLSAETADTKEQSLLHSFRKYICNCEFALNGLIPSIPRSILPDPAERAQAYRNLSSMRSESEIDLEFEAILGGRPAPRALVHFSFMMKSRLHARQLAIERIHSDGWDVLLQSPAPYRVWEMLLERLFRNSGGLSAPCKLSADRIYCRQNAESTQIVLRNIGKFPVEKQVELVLDFLRSCAKLCKGRGSSREAQRVPSGTGLSLPSK